MTSPRWNSEPQSSHRAVPPRPQLGVVEREDGFAILAELPSAHPEDVSVQLHGGDLTIRARWPAVPGADAVGTPGWQVSLAFGRLVRGDAQIVVQDGILLVTLPKARSGEADDATYDEPDPPAN